MALGPWWQPGLTLASTPTLGSADGGGCANAARLLSGFIRSRWARGTCENCDGVDMREEVIFRSSCPHETIAAKGGKLSVLLVDAARSRRESHASAVGARSVDCALGTPIPPHRPGPPMDDWQWPGDPSDLPLIAQVRALLATLTESLIFGVCPAIRSSASGRADNASFPPPLVRRQSTGRSATWRCYITSQSRHLP